MRLVLSFMTHRCVIMMQNLVKFLYLLFLIQVCQFSYAQNPSWANENHPKNHTETLKKPQNPAVRVCCEGNDDLIDSAHSKSHIPKITLFGITVLNPTKIKQNFSLNSNGKKDLSMGNFAGIQIDF